jgi:hypothetical protein
METVVVTEVCYIINDQLVEVVFHIFHERLSCS